MSSPHDATTEAALSIPQVIEIMREVSLQSDPQRMITIFRRHTMTLFGGDGSISLSRRGLSYPEFRITRSTRWTSDVDPWKDPHKLPLVRGGLLADFLHRDAAQIIDDIEIPEDDPAHPHLSGARSLMIVPLFEAGAAMNMVVRYSLEPCGFRHDRLADAILIANLFGKATGHLVTAQRLAKTNAELDHEMKRVAALQRSLLPPRLPAIPGVNVAVSYKTAARAGGDYYDFFDLGDGRFGVLIADVSGHGTPAAVVMAIMRTMLQNQCIRHRAPGELLSAANGQLCEQSRRYDGMFVTAFYGIYEPRDRSMRYASAGHNPPLLVGTDRGVRELDEAQALPLAVDGGSEFPESTARLAGSDTLLLYTDGITDATNAAGEVYGRERLLACVREDVPFAQHVVDCVTHRLIAFTDGRPQEDDQTLVAMRVH